jgi:hypothetical protein
VWLNNERALEDISAAAKFKLEVEGERLEEDRGELDVSLHS